MQQENFNPFDPATRAKYVGGTDASAVCGLSKWRTPYQVFLEKTGQPQEFDDDNEMFIWGHLLEPVIADEWVRRNPEYEIVSSNRCVDDPDYNYMKVNLDREVRHKLTGETFILEVKTVATTAYKQWQLGVPLDYYSQVQYQLGVTGYDKAIFVILLMDSRTMETFEVARDDSYIAEMRNEVVDFWENHVEKNIAPPMTVKDFAGIRPEPKTVEADKDFVNLHKHLIELKADKKRLEGEITGLEDQFKMKIGDAEVLIFGDDVLISWKGSDTTRVDSKKLKAEKLEIYEAYSNKTFSRRFLVKGAAEE